MIGTNCCRCDPNFKSRKRHPCRWGSCSMWVVCPQVATNSQCESSLWLCFGVGIVVDDDDDVKLAENTLLWKRWATELDGTLKPDKQIMGWEFAKKVNTRVLFSHGNSKHPWTIHLEHWPTGYAEECTRQIGSYRLACASPALFFVFRVSLG